ncbi:hypothetical protein [Dactylosporangium sp. NPDC049140]|uniref:hypothetical protein n=1 Tax=Dactylosporangium sp. NPDC049140 TaxID=3155647 RepID=UPI0033FCF11F
MWTMPVARGDNGRPKPDFEGFGGVHNSTFGAILGRLFRVPAQMRADAIAAPVRDGTNG